MSLSSPTTHIHPMLKELNKGEERDRDGNDVSMDEDEEDTSGGDKLTSEMNADERREKLRRRASRKNGKEEDAEDGSG